MSRPLFASAELELTAFLGRLPYPILPLQLEMVCFFLSGDLSTTPIESFADAILLAPLQIRFGKPLTFTIGELISVTWILHLYSHCERLLYGRGTTDYGELYSVKCSSFL